MKQHLLPTRAAGRVGSDGVQGRITIPSAALVPRIVLKLLYNLNEKNLAYRSINVYRLILSETLDQMAGFDVSKTPRIIKLREGMPKYTGFLDVGVLLLLMVSLGTDVRQSLTTLSHNFFVLFNMIVAER